MLAWLSLDTWLISGLSIAYLILLFIIAYWGQNQSPKHWTSRPVVYSLSLGVSCTSWAFYGTVGQAASTGAWIAPIYIGTILTMVLAWPMLVKILRIIKEQNLTSIADFIAFRYDRSGKIAATVALVVLIGIIPYIALQLRAISVSFDLLTGTYQSGISTAFIVTLVLIVFSIFFGTRQIAANKQNQGLVLAIAASSVVKLFALTAVGLFATFYVFDGFSDLLSQEQQSISYTGVDSIYLSFAQALLGAITVFILPQQFHLMMIENHHQQELKTARWLYPVYLLLINIFVLPIAIAGQLTFPGGSVDADIFVLTLPLYYQQAWLGIVVYIGGLAAATSMVIVSAIVLSLMISTEIITPLMLKLRRFNSQQVPQMSSLLLNLRRGAIAVILLLAFAFERIIAQQSHLASIGLLSFVLLSQFAPATLGALYWRKGTAKGAFIGLLAGTLLWCYTLLLPTLMPHFSWLSTGPLGIAWLKPQALFGVDFGDVVSHGVFYSLLLNTLCYVFISLVSHRSVGEKLQAELYISKSQSQFERHLTLDDLYNLLQRFTDSATAEKVHGMAGKKGDASLSQAIEYTRLQLSAVLGSASTRMVMKAASTSQEMPLEDVVSIVDEANQMFRFNRELLQSGVENIEQGISVVDADMRLVAWNQRYVELLDYPPGFVVVGKPIAELLRYNIGKGYISGACDEELIARRLEHMRAGHSHHFQRSMPNGLVLEIRGQPMPGGGFVSTFSDITEHIENKKALQKANETLEKRVAQRTRELELAMAQAKAADSSKTRFLAAASHDLMQPFNALSLFTSMLKNKVDTDELSQLANHIDDSLNVVEALLSDLVEISKLDGGSQTVDMSDFAIDELLGPLNNEFNLLAQQEGISFSYPHSSLWVRSDKQMLRRVLQNFLSNAVHYCKDKHDGDHQKTSKIVLGVRRTTSHLNVEVWDNGPGIASDQQQKIFEEFERLERNRDVPGLGLGLAICERIAGLLGLSISLRSTLGTGTCFSIALPLAKPKNLPKVTLEEEIKVARADELNRQCVLVIDNDVLSLTAMTSQLQLWGCEVISAKDKQDAVDQLDKAGHAPHLIISDYHLDNDCNGVDVTNELLASLTDCIPCVICSADPSEQVREHTSSAQFLFLRKPVKALALKRVMRQVLS